MLAVMPLVWCQVQVDWEFWTNSNDQCGTVCDSQRDFIRVRGPMRFESTAEALPKWKPKYYRILE